MNAGVAERLVDAPIWRRAWMRWMIGVLALAGFVTVVCVPLELWQQLLFGGGSIVISVFLSRRQGRLVSLTLMLLSLCASLRYMYWRLTSTVDFTDWIDAGFGWGLVLAELYALVVLVLGYWQTAWPLQRKPALMDGDARD